MTSEELSFMLFPSAFTFLQFKLFCYRFKTPYFKNRKKIQVVASYKWSSGSTSLFLFTIDNLILTSPPSINLKFDLVPVFYIKIPCISDYEYDVQKELVQHLVKLGEKTFNCGSVQAFIPSSW